MVGVQAVPRATAIPIRKGHLSRSRPGPRSGRPRIPRLQDRSGASLGGRSVSDQEGGRCQTRPREVGVRPDQGRSVSDHKGGLCQTTREVCVRPGFRFFRAVGLTHPQRLLQLSRTRTHVFSMGQPPGKPTPPIRKAVQEGRAQQLSRLPKGGPGLLRPRPHSRVRGAGAQGTQTTNCTIPPITELFPPCATGHASPATQKSGCSGLLSGWPTDSTRFMQLDPAF
jgi:hypothetical protein